MSIWVMCSKCRASEQLTKTLGTDFFLAGLCEKCEANERRHRPKLKENQQRARLSTWRARRDAVAEAIAVDKKEGES